MPSLNDEILVAVSQVESQDSRVVLTLLARVHTDITSRLDKFLADEHRIRSMVLNGHMETHHEDHGWLRENKGALEQLIQFGEGRSANGGYCDYAARMLADEKDTETRKRNALWGIGERTLIAAASIMGTLIVLGAVKWLEMP